ncbi:MAG: hypothetical protein AAGC55_34050, partial [Myxococcota bacterium]
MLSVGDHRETSLNGITPSSLRLSWRHVMAISGGGGVPLSTRLAPRPRSSRESYILVLDELERVLPRDGQDQRTARFVKMAGALRALVQNEAKGWLSIIAIDLRATSTRQNLLPGGDTNPFFHLFVERALPMLTQADIGEMSESIGRKMSITEVEPRFVERLYQASGGHPALAWMLAAAAYEGRIDNSRLATGDLDRGLEELDDQDALGNFFAQNVWSATTAHERALLVEAARAGTVTRPR